MRALITGVLGQDGSHLAEQLVSQGHTVYGLTRRPNATSPATLLVGDLLDQDSLERALVTAEPDVVFNLAAVTSPGGGWGAVNPPHLVEVTGGGVVKLLNAMTVYASRARLVHASTSAVLEPERYGLYGAAKRLAHDAVVGYRDRLKTTNAILFSHTSPRQDPQFLARRICNTIATGGTLRLSDLKPRRDWGWSPDYCEALQVLAEAEPGDWVVATGEQHSVGELVANALEVTGRDWSCVEEIDGPTYSDEISTEGMPSVRDLGWRPRTSFYAIARELVAAGRNCG